MSPAGDMEGGEADGQQTGQGMLKHRDRQGEGPSLSTGTCGWATHTPEFPAAHGRGLSELAGSWVWSSPAASHLYHCLRGCWRLPAQPWPGLSPRAGPLCDL